PHEFRRVARTSSVESTDGVDGAISAGYGGQAGARCWQGIGFGPGGGTGPIPLDRIELNGIVLSPQGIDTPIAERGGCQADAESRHARHGGPATRAWAIRLHGVDNVVAPIESADRINTAIAAHRG